MNEALMLTLCMEENTLLISNGVLRQLGSPPMIQIRIKKGEPIDRALKRMKKILDKEGIMKQIRANRYFEKPSEKKRKKAARARIRTFSRRTPSI